MALFVVNIRPLKFHLLGLPKSEHDKYEKLITDNGGVVSVTGDYPVINFSMPGCFPNDKMVFHVRYIEECIKENRILDLVDFNVPEENGYEGCALSMFLFHTPRCKLAITSTPCTMLTNNGDSQHNNTDDDTDEDETKFLIKDDKSFITSLCERRSRSSTPVAMLTNNVDSQHNKTDDDTDEDKTKFLIRDDKPFITSSYERRSRSSTPVAMLTNNGDSQHNKTDDDTDEDDTQSLIKDDKSFITSSYKRRSRSSTPIAMLTNNGDSQHNKTDDDTDEDETKFSIKDDNSFITSSYERRSSEENDSNNVEKLYTDCNITEDSDTNNITDDISDNSGNTRTIFTSEKCVNIKLEEN